MTSVVEWFSSETFVTCWGACLWRRSGRLHNAEESQNTRAGRASQKIKPNCLILHMGTLRLRAESSLFKVSESVEEGMLVVIYWLFTALLTTILFDCCDPHFMEGSVVRGGAAIRTQACFTQSPRLTSAPSCPLLRAALSFPFMPL